jgi:ADP-ribosylglycohydrolase
MIDDLLSKNKSEKNRANIQRLYDRFLPAMYGGIIGDALGFPYEFKERGSFPKVSGMEGQKPGTWTDDTSLTLCLIENIIENGDQDSLMEKFINYYKSGYWTPFGKMFAIGAATERSINMYIHGKPAKKCGQAGEFDNGNGAIMRIAPVAFVMGDCFDFRKLVRNVEKYAVITHAHPRSTLGCIIYSGILFRLSHNDDLPKALDMAAELCRMHLVKTKYEKELPAYERIFNNSIKDLAMPQIISDGYAVHSLEAALWCCFQTNNFRDAVLAAVNLGGDTDTIAAIAGTIAGTFYKMDGIPEEWLNAIMRKKEIDSLLDRFCSHSPHFIEGIQNRAL